MKIAILYWNLSENLYIEPPFGYPLPAPNLVCKFYQSFYGLKLARTWFKKLRSIIYFPSFQQSSNDYSIFTVHSIDARIIPLLYADGMIIIESDNNCITQLKSFLHAFFRIKDLGILTCFLGLDEYFLGNESITKT